MKVLGRKNVNKEIRIKENKVNLMAVNTTFQIANKIFVIIAI